MADYFLDTSALAKLYHAESGTDFVRQLLAQPSARAIVSRLSVVEIESVFAIKVRTGELDAAGQELARRRFLADVSQRRLIVAPAITEMHYQAARGLLERFAVSHALRTLDALQLAVAMDLHRRGVISAIISADRRMCRVAEACGCTAIDPANPGPLVR